MNYCPTCGHKVEETMKFCSNCGEKLVDNEKRIEKEKQVESKETKSSTLIIERAEPTFYSDEKGVRITSTRLIIPGKKVNDGPSTYVMANITSVKTEKQEPNRLGGILVAVLGIIFIIVGIALHTVSVSIIGAVILVLGLALAILVKPTYHLKIASASGETDALPPQKDKQYIDRIIMAINEALIKRG
jgi:endogenous inhibitor of DNA gyrase (YacG/DUF329 family)